MIMKHRMNWGASRRNLMCAALALCLLCAVAWVPAQADYVPPPTLAFGIVIDSANSEALPYLYEKPDDKSNAVTMLPVGSSLEVYEDVDEDWVRVNAAPYGGYIRKEHLKLYPADALFLEDTAPIYEAGSYAVGTDLSAGLYSFTVAEKAVETLEIALNGSSRSYEMTGGYGTYDYYLPEGATVTLSGGHFAPMVDRGFDFPDHDARYARFGRFVTCKSISAGYFTVELAPGAESGYFVVSSLADEEDLSVELRRVEIVPGKAYEEIVPEGMFVEYFNCISPGNG
ncbi:MAG TPA: SH3 domain-containing protein [Clostridia bacterium]|nr:SH3 domain-containing protein [Clostridia bacterium]